jgi:D-aspartate ligase
MPSKSTMQMLMNKSSFQQSAEELKSPIPRSVRLTPNIKLERIDLVRYPCVIKPLVKNAEYSRRFVKAYKVSSARDAAELWTELSTVVSEAIMQEWIEGSDSDVYFCLQYRGPSGAPAVSFVGRKVCQWPPMIGGTASCVSAPDAFDELVASTNAYFEAVGFVGLCSMEYKRDTRDNRFYMVEPTVGRTDYQEEIATLNGVNIPFAAYCGELGRKLSASISIYPPRAWRDSMSYAKARLAGAPDHLGLISPDARIVDALFRANDPMPYVATKFEPVSRWLSSLLSRSQISKGAPGS